ncbi:MAG: OFA family MFS transporter [Spirochaetes bacterium]|nr:OFA family MFS transporter [Spirochaetota bacterium]
MKKIELKYLYILIGIIINMCLGAIYSWSIFRKPLEELLNINSTSSGLPYMVFLISYAITMPIAGNFIKKTGPRLMTLIGGIIVALAWILSSFVTDIKLITITYGVLGGIGVGIVYGVPMAVSARWFPDKKGFAVGLTLSGFGLSPFVTAPLSRYLISQFGVFPTFRILGFIFIGVIILLALPLKVPENGVKNKQQDAGKNQSVWSVISDSKFIVLWICFIIGAFTGLMAISISSPVAEEIVGLNPIIGALTVALFSIFNGTGRPLFGIITDKVHFKKAAILSFSLIILAAIMMLQVKKGSVLLYIVAFSLFWLNLGGWLAIAPTAVSNMFGAENYARNYGVLFTAYGVGAIISNLTSGLIRDYFGSYTFVFYPAIIFAIFGILLIVFTFREKKTVEYERLAENNSVS